MKLQNIVFPSTKNCAEELYFRSNRKQDLHMDREKGILCLAEGTQASFDTYFNGFSVGKWLKYTRIDDVTLRLKLKGKAVIFLVHNESTTTNTINQEIDSLIYDTEGKIEEITITIDDNKSKGIYTFYCQALEGGCEIHGGYWSTDVEQVSNVKLGIVICTFLREQYIDQNIGILKKEFFENPKSDLVDRLVVYISDNGKTLDTNRMYSRHIKILPNRNAGGVGGFTRGLIEILKTKETNEITHVLLMDDDIVICPESIYRTYAMWALLKDEYRESFIGGGVLNLETPWLQIESGALWNTGKVQSRKQGLDLRNVVSCIQNEVEEDTDYQGWWYCSFSLEHVRENNLPLPLFIKVDDVEYSIRNMKHLILLNGICAWHEPFEYKNRSSFYYYWYRNWLICNAVNGMIDARVKDLFWKELQARVIQEAFTLRYKNAELLLNAVEDFLKGIDWLKKQSPEKLNRLIVNKGYALAPVEDLEIPFNKSEYLETTKAYVEGRVRRVWRKISCNGIFLKSHGTAIVPTVNPYIYYFYKKSKALNYETASNMGFVTTKDNKEFIRLVKKLYLVKIQFKGRYNEISREYYSRSEELMKLSFWEIYLKL